MENKILLPIGTVVAVGNSETEEVAPIIIVGYAGQGTENRIYDYIGFLYPYGFEDREHVVVFNENRIKKVLYLGYKDKDYEECIPGIMAMIDDARGGK